MVELGTAYLAVTGALLLVALGVGFRVLRGIARDGRDLSRRRRAGEAETNPDDEEYGSDPSPGSEEDRARTAQSGDPTVICPRCGVANESGFDYCRRCAAQLPRGA
jgi:hypothetical protein